MKYLHTIIYIFTLINVLHASEATLVSSENFIKKWAASFNQNDAVAISSFYDKHDQVDMLVSVGLWNKGHKAILTSYKQDMKAVQFYDSSITKLNTRVYDKTALVSFIHKFKYRLFEDDSH